MLSNPPNPCSKLNRLPRSALGPNADGSGKPDSLSASQTYQLAHSVECRLMMSASRSDRDLRFVLGHAFTLDKIKLRLVEIEEQENEKAKQQAKLDEVLRKKNGEGGDKVRFGVGSVRQEQGRGLPRSKNGGRRSPPPPQLGMKRKGDLGRKAEEVSSDSEDTTDDDDEEMEALALTLTTSNINKGPPKTGNATLQRVRDTVDELIPSNDSDSDSESETEEYEDMDPEKLGLSNDLLETIIEKPADEELAELYEHVAGCPCHGDKGAPVVEQIWEIPEEVLNEERRKREEQKDKEREAAGKKKRLGKPMGAGRRIGIVRVAA